MNQNKKIIVHDWGLKDYQEAWDEQERLLAETVDLKVKNRNHGGDLPTPNHLIFVEHPHVYTLGKSGKPENLLVNEDDLPAIQASYYKVNRGGDITYHGPGQIVAYPIIDLENFFTDIHRYLRTLEEAVIKTLAEYGVRGERFEGYTGVWLDADNDRARKICAMGVRCSRWVTMHGLALNVNTDLSYFKNIVPCSIDDKDVTSIQREVDREVDMTEVKEKLLRHMIELFEIEI